MHAHLSKISLSYERAVYIAILFMTFYTAPLFSYCPIRFSDIGGLILLYIGYKANKSIQYASYNILYLLLASWAVADFVIIGFLFPDLDSVNYITQLVRLEIAILVFLYTPNIFKVLSLDVIINAIKKVVLTHAIVQIVFVILYFLHIRFCFNIIETFDERLALISENELFFNHFFIVNTSNGSPRFSGFFEEPAWFGWNMNLMLALILQTNLMYSQYQSILSKKDWMIILISYVFTFSLSAIFSLCVILFLYIAPKYKQHIGKLILLLIGLVIGIALFVISNPAILNRLLLISEGGDGSTSSRLIGSWNALITTLHVFPITGYGLGDTNSSLFFSYAREHSIEQGIEIGNLHLMEIHNLICQIICSLGLIGGILLLMPFLQLCKRKTILIAAGFILVFFSVNVFNTFFFFSMAAFTCYLFLNHNYSNSHLKN